MMSKLPIGTCLPVFLLACICVIADAVEPLSPASLIAEGGNQRVYLEWNPSTFDEVAGYRVYRSEGKGNAELITPALIVIPEYIDENVANGMQYSYTVTGVIADGGETPHSNRATATPVQTQNPQRHGSRFVFPDGQEITFDGNTWKLISWKSAEGEALAVPTAYGSPVALTGFDERGLSFPDPATPDRPVMTKPISKEYSRVEGVDVSIDDGRVTIGYRIPLHEAGSPPGGHDSIWMTVWQTWWPVERRIGPTVYRGLARRIELDWFGE